MDKDILAALKRINTVAHYALEQEVVPHSEVAQTLAYIIDEVTETITQAENATPDLLAALETVLLAHRYDGALTNGTAALSPAIAGTVERAISKAKGN